MSLPELLLIALVACIAFSPAKLPMLARHLTLVFRQLSQLKKQTTLFWHKQMQQLQLYENQRKAAEKEQEKDR